MKAEKIIKRVKRYDTVSFDIFDTLIARKVSTPTDIFQLVAKEAGMDELAFKEKRIYAEKVARQKAASQGEVTLDGIYDEMTDIDSAELKKWKKLELDIEYMQCEPIPELYQVFEWAKQNQKNIVIVSDMYLPADHIAKMLEKCGYTGYQKLYVSNQYGVNKISGKLFEIVWNELEPADRKMIHIGDSIKADFLGAMKAHIPSILISRQNRLLRLLKR